MRDIRHACAGFVFAAPSIDDGVVGLFYGGGAGLFIKQLVGVVAVGVFTFVLSFILWHVVKGLMGVRVSAEDELAGLDLSEHGMEAYAGERLG